jgi:hypothetical protein
MIGWLLSQILLLIGLGFLLLLIGAILAPLESLGWWAGWSAEKPGYIGPDEELIEAGKSQPVENYYLVYLSGIGVASADGLAKDEVDFLNQMEIDLPDARIISDVFPYSVNNNPLTGQRALTPLWRWLRAKQEKNPDSLIALLFINLRNMLQVAVSADPRYGPIYNLGIADEIADSLARHGYPFGSGKPVFLIGFSGGGQVSVGCATYLAPMIAAPVYVISIGGVLSDDPGINHVRHLTHLWGQKDPLQGIGGILWSGRWSVFPQSDWNRAKAAGRISMVAMGPMAHNALGGYYDIRVALPDGTNHCVATSARVKSEILRLSQA